jgi:hypothetical protein
MHNPFVPGKHPRVTLRSLGKLPFAIAMFAAAIVVASAVGLRAAPRISASAMPVAVTGPAPQAAAISAGGRIDIRKLPALTPGEFQARGAKPLMVPNLSAWLRQKAASAMAGAAVPMAMAPLGVVVMPPTLGTNFVGIDQPSSDCPCEPPDTNVAAGPDQVVEVINLSLRIFDKSGNPQGNPVFLNTFFGIGGAFSSDPKVRYDPASQRWFVSLLSLNGSKLTNSAYGQIDLAVSSGPDLSTATWNTYAFVTPSSFPDQPDLGFSSDKVVLSANGFACQPVSAGGCNAADMTDSVGSAPAVSSGNGNEFFVIDKSDVIGGAPIPRADYYPPGQDGATFSIQPARMMPGTSPQPTTVYMASVEFPSSNVIHVFTVDGVPTGSPNPPGTSYSVTSLTINSLASPPSAVQPSGGLSANFTGDNRLEDAMWQDGHLWVAANSACKPQGDTSTRDCMRFIEVLTDSPMQVNQDFDYGTPNTDYYYPAVQTDQLGNLVTVFSRSSSAEFPSVYFASRLASDPLNSMSFPVLIQRGKTNYTSSYHRWGDYSGASVDPSDGTKIWVAGEYATSASSPNWGTWIAQVEAGSAGAPSPTPTATPTPDPPPGKLRLSTHRVGFGETPTGGSHTRAFKIKNKGKGPLAVNLIAPSAPFTIVGGQASLDIPAGQQAAVSIQFAPSLSGRFVQWLSLTSNDPDSPSARVKLVGKGASSKTHAQASVSGEPLTLGP